MSRISGSLFIVLIAASIAGVAQGADHTPKGMVAFFTTEGCPTGWSVPSYAQGRLIVGTSSSVGKTVGTRLSPATEPVHQHPFQVSLTIQQRGLAAGMSCCNETGAKYGTYTAPAASGTSSSSNGNLPYIQLTVCERQ